MVRYGISKTELLFLNLMGSLYFDLLLQTVPGALCMLEGCYCALENDMPIRGRLREA